MSTWTINLSFTEDPDFTQAIALLHTPGGRELRGLGQSRRNPEDRPVTEIGEEVAGARALSSLAHELLSFAAEQIERNAVRDDPGGVSR